MTLTQSIQLRDGMTGVLRSINQAMDLTIRGFGRLSAASGRAMPTAEFDLARERINAASGAIAEMERRQNEYNDSVQRGATANNSLLSAAQRTFDALGGTQSIMGIVKLSDQLAQTKGRLDMMNDGLQSTDALNDLIMQSAQRSRLSYQQTADVVTSLGLHAGSAFKDNGETVAFAEQLNKQFAIAGASQQDSEVATLQLTQAFGSGTLSGDAFNAVFETAPNMMQTLADYTGMPIGALREMAEEGQLSAELVKNALLAAAEQTNAKFDALPYTWAQRWTWFCNVAIQLFGPLLTKLNEVANGERFKNFAAGAANALAMLSMIVNGVFDAMLNGIAWVADNWSWLSPVIYGVIAALVVYNATAGISWFSTMQQAAALAWKTVCSWAETAAIFAMIVAQDGLNAALVACPITWIIIGIIAIVALFYAAVAAVNHFAGTTASATGIICGIITSALAIIANAFIQLYNLAIVPVCVLIWNVIADVANFIGNVFHDPIGAAARMFFGFADSILDVLQTLAGAIDGIFGKNLSGTVQGWRDSLGSWVDDKFGQGVEIMQKVTAKDFTASTIDVGKAWNVGYNFGAGLEDKVSNLFNPSDILDSAQKDALDYTSSASSQEMLGAANDTADNTGRMADSLEISEEDLKYMRDIAERETINRFTTAEIKLDMINYNTLTGTNDLDGIVDELGGRLHEMMIVSAEGVHD